MKTFVFTNRVSMLLLFVMLLAFMNSVYGFECQLGGSSETILDKINPINPKSCPTFLDSSDKKFCCREPNTGLSICCDFQDFVGNLTVEEQGCIPTIKKILPLRPPPPVFVNRTLVDMMPLSQGTDLHRSDTDLQVAPGAAAPQAGTEATPGKEAVTMGPFTLPYYPGPNSFIGSYNYTLGTCPSW